MAETCINTIPKARASCRAVDMFIEVDGTYTCECAPLEPTSVFSCHDLQYVKLPFSRATAFYTMYISRRLFSQFQFPELDLALFYDGHTTAIEPTQRRVS